MRHAVFVNVLVTWLVLTCATARADSWGSPQDLAATSPSGKVGVRIRPDPTGVSIKVTRAGAEKTWRGVNPEAPVLAFVCDGGAVVTLNEWAHVGYEHALVLYAPDGRVLADRGLDELLTPDELDTKVKHSVSSRWWLADDQPARCDGARFLAPTRWGTTIVVTLADGALARAIPTARERLDAQARGKRPFQGVTFRIETARHTATDVGGVSCDVAAPKATCTTWGKTLAQPSERAVTPEALARALRAWAQLADRQRTTPGLSIEGRVDQVVIQLSVVDGGYAYPTTWVWTLDPGFGAGREALAVLLRLAGQPAWPP